jgi:ABC-type spermidine/putrescine transport system permease subunit I
VSAVSDVPDRPPLRDGTAGRRDGYDRRSRWLWIGLAAPGAIWLIVLFVVPFYVMLSVAGGGVNQFFQTAIPVWNPLNWSSTNLTAVWHDIVGQGSYLGPLVFRTLVYTAIATALSLGIAYPVAYFVSRYAGTRKTLFLVLLIAPFWVSYMMRMLAWIDLLQQNGIFNSALSDVGLPGSTDWLGGKSVVVILGLVYGYIPYLILVLYAFLDRIDQNLIEAARDLGLSKWRAFIHVTVPLSKPAIVAGTFITVLPMLGDYFTNQLMSAAPGTTMIGNAIEGQLDSPGQVGQGAVLAMMMLAVLLIPMTYYVISTTRASREAG